MPKFDVKAKALVLVRADVIARVEADSAEEAMNYTENQDKALLDVEVAINFDDIVGIQEGSMSIDSAQLVVEEEGEANDG